MRSGEETREERRGEDRRREERRGDLNRICKLSLTYIALQTNKNNVCTRCYATLAVLTLQLKPHTPKFFIPSLLLCERVDQIFFQLYLHTWMTDKTQIPDRVWSYATSDGSWKLHKGTVHRSLLGWGGTTS